jgi:hypothetical protein
VHLIEHRAALSGPVNAPVGYGSVSAHKNSGELAKMALQYVGLAPAG